MTSSDLVNLSSELCQRGQAHAWVTVVAVQKPSSAYLGAQAIVEADGSMHGWIGGGCVRGVALASALRTLASGIPQRIRLSNAGDGDDAVDVRPMTCASNGEVELFIQPVEIAPRLRVYGATPVAKAAALIARQSDFDPLTDDEAADAAGEQPISVVESYALVATQGDGDEAALEHALRSPACAILLIASRRKAERLRAAMASRGISIERLESVHAPAGPDIGAVTPNEIALAAIAGLVALRRRPHEAKSSTESAKPPATETSGNATGYINPVCGAVVDPARAMSSVTMDEQTHYFCCVGCRAEFDRNPEKYLAIGRSLREPARNKTS